MRDLARGCPRHRFTRRPPVKCLALALLLLTAPAWADDKVVNVYNWTDYIDPAALEQFTAETGIEVRYDVFDSLETLEGKLLAGNSGYDIVVPSNEPTFSRLIHAGALAEIDRSRVPNWKNLDPALMRRVEASDPGNKHGAIYLWGTIGLGANVEKIRALAPDAPLDSWDLLFKPENAKRIAACGIIDDGLGDRCDPIGVEVPRPQSGQQHAGRSRGGRAGAAGDPPLYPLVRQRRRAGGAGDRADLPRVRLFR